MRIVKVLVLFMGVLIVVGIGLVAYGLSLDKNADDPKTTSVSPVTPPVPLAGDVVSLNAAPVVPSVSLSAFGDIAVDMAPGEKLVSYSRQGNDVTLHIEGDEGNASRLVIVSIEKKKVLGRILLGSSAQ